MSAATKRAQGAETRAKVIAAYADGHTTACAIARELGMNQSGISRHMRAAGLVSTYVHPEREWCSELYQRQMPMLAEPWLFPDTVTLEEWLTA